MKVVVWRSGLYIPIREMGSLKPLTELSLAEQLSIWRRDMIPTDPPRYLVFTSEEEQMVSTALGLLARNMGHDRGLGRIDWLDRRLLRQIAEATGWQVQVIPADGDGTIPDSLITAWSLALRPFS